MKKEKIQLNGILFDKNNIGKLIKTEHPHTAWENAINQFLIEWFSNSEWITTHTSGSTGLPKEIRLSKNAMRNSAQMTNAFFNLNETKTALLCLPATYIAGKMMLVRAIIGGFNLITTEPKANPFENITQKIDFVAITPYQLYYSADTLKIRDVSDVIVGGGRVNSNLEKIAKELPCRLFETYGMTETCSHIALRCLNGNNKSDFFTYLMQFLSGKISVVA